MGNARLDESQGGMKTAGRSINHLRYSEDTTLMAESKEQKQHKQQQKKPQTLDEGERGV